MLYQLHAIGMESLQPLNRAAKTARHLLSHPFHPWSGSWLGQGLNAGFELFERMTAYYERPAWGFTTVEIDGRDVPIRQETVHSLPWCDLLRFRRDYGLEVPDPHPQPKVLFVAPMSGHYPTLLRNHVRFFLGDFDCYVTEWANARDVALSDGTFHLDDYVEYIMDFVRLLGPSTHVVAVCQPGVPALMAAAVMAMADDPAVPASLTLISAPIDTRCNPTEVNDYASRHDYEWFERNDIFEVHYGFLGFGQKVYPGFIQLSCFLSLNLDNHIRRHNKFYQDLL
jgi:poly(3-hydroxybutyrate) depolymerase